MGLFDFSARPAASRDEVAIQIDLACGVLEECPVCRTRFDRQHDDRLAAAEQMARRRIADRDPGVAVFAGDLDDLLHRLRAVRERFGYHCRCQEAG